MEQNTGAGRVSRRNMIVAGSAAAVAALGVGRARAAEFNYKLGLELLADEPLPRRMLEACKAIAEETGGRLQIQGFPNGQLGSPAETFSQVRSGSLEFLTTSYGILSTAVLAAGLPSLGFVFSSYDKLWHAIDGELGKFIAKAVERRGELVVFPGVMDVGFRQITSSKRTVADPKDLRGLKIRTPPSQFITSLFKALGASPTPISFADLYTSLQTGTVDGQENSLPLVQSFKFYEVQKFCTLTSHAWEGWVPVANRQAWQRLPENLREVVSRNFMKAALQQRKDFAQQQINVQASLAAKGMNFETPAPGVYRDALKKTTFYSDWKARVGGEAWEALEGAAGKLV
jgi:tripartite ATP-independent transporter DctP family solute receptor